MLISVIITTKNEEAHIENCLKSIKEQSYLQDQIEIVVVDNDSSDRTKEIAKRYTEKVFDKGPERSAQRNFGVENSDGEYFLYLDADMILNKDVIRDCVEKIKSDQKIIALYISEIVMGEKFWSKVRRFERSFYDGTVIDCARFIQKEAFQKVNGFDEDLTGPEDWDLDKKLRNIYPVANSSSATGVEKTYSGTGIELVTTPIYHNEAEFNLKKYLSKKRYYAKKFDAYIQKWGKNDLDLKKQFGVYYRFLGVFIERGNWKKMFIHPVLTLGMYYLRLMVGLKFLTRKK